MYQPGMRPTWVEVNTRSIARNLRHIKSALPPDTQILAVVKADGYGHGAAPVAIRALEEGVSFLGVALVEEGVALRRAGIAAPILFMESPFPWQALDLVKYGLTATVASYESADMLSDAAVVLGKRAKVHVKVDTGMGRLGLSPTATFGLVRHVAKLPGIEIEGIFTHLACAESNLNMTRRQLEQFDELGSKLSAEGYDIPIRHAANSAAALTLPETFYDMVRVGGIMYGLSPLGTVAPSEPWTPALSFHTRVSYIKLVRPETPISYGASYVTSGPELIATLPVGYADGYPRALSNVGEVLIGGRRCPIAGRVCMDQVMVSLPPDADVKVGDEVVLIGAQGEERIFAEEIARATGTIGYEVVCAISKRVPRVYVADDR